MEKHDTPNNSDEGAVNSTSKLPGSETANISEVLKRLRGDQELLGELIACYKEDYEELLEELSTAVSGGDARAAHRLAHGFKGLVSNFDAEYTHQYAMQIELAAKRGDLDSAAKILPMLKESAHALADVLDSF